MINLPKVENNLITNIVKENVSNLLNMPTFNVGYGQTPFIPLDLKLYEWNRYIVTLVQAMQGIFKVKQAFGLDLSKTALTLTDIAERIDFPISSRLIAFRPKDNTQPHWMFPLIVLPVNPNSFRVEYKKRSDLVYTLGGFVVTHWHDDAITITASGYIPSFRNKTKILTPSYQYFLKFLDLYLNCGKINSVPMNTITALTLDQKKMLSEQVNIKKEASEAIASSSAFKNIKVLIHKLQNALIELRYQQDVYTGIFLSFTITEEYEQPNTLSYDFVFKALSKKDVVFGSLTGSSELSPIESAIGGVSNTLTGLFFK